MGIFNIFFKRLFEERFGDLELIVIENFKIVPLCPINRRPLKVFAKLHKSPLLIANTVKSAVSGLRQFLATESLEKS